MAPTGQQYDNKTGQWFGSLVRSSGEDGVVLVRLFILIDTLISKISRLIYDMFIYVTSIFLNV